jgi:hypothetical protein
MQEFTGAPERQRFCRSVHPRSRAGDRRLRRASVDEASEVRKGQVLAIKACSTRHVVSERVGRPFAERVGPPFAKIAKGNHAAPDSLRDFLRSTHSPVSHPNAMPAPEVTERQSEELSPSIASLRQV